jgi:hypothetical protein
MIHATLMEVYASTFLGHITFLEIEISPMTVLFEPKHVAKYMT